MESLYNVVKSIVESRRPWCGFTKSIHSITNDISIGFGKCLYETIKKTEFKEFAETTIPFMNESTDFMNAVSHASAMLLIPAEYKNMAGEYLCVDFLRTIKNERDVNTGISMSLLILDTVKPIRDSLLAIYKNELISLIDSQKAISLIQ